MSENQRKPIMPRGRTLTAIGELAKSLAKGRKGKRRFYSRSVAFIIEQIEWLKYPPVDGSQLLRWLVEGAMTEVDFLVLAKRCVDIISLERRIEYLELRVKRGEEIDQEIYEDLKKKRMKAIASLIQPTTD